MSVVLNQAWSSAKAICRVQILSDLHLYESHLPLKFCLTEQNGASERQPDLQRYTRSTIWKIIFFATSEKQTLCNKIKGI